MESISESISACTGCMACYNICSEKAIKIVENKKGFYVPKIQKEQCINCNRCKKVCPANSQRISYSVKEKYAAKRKKKRMKSQSGGDQL